MIKTGSAIFFETAEDFTKYCKQDTLSKEYTYNMCSIKYPLGFPAAYKYESGFDAHFAGRYVETPLDKAIYDSLRSLENEIRNAELQISQLNRLNAAKSSV